MIDKDIFEKDGFIINTGNSTTAPEIVSELMTILELPDAKGKKICLKVGSVDLTQSQILTIKALIETLGSFLEIIDTDSEQTKAAAEGLNIITEKFSNEIVVEEQESADLEIKEIEVGEPKDGLSYELNENSLTIDEETTQIIDKLIQPEFIQSSIDEVENINETETTETETEVEAEAGEISTVEDNSTVEEIEENSQKNEEEILALEEISKFPTFYLKQNLRSGQTMSYDGNIVLIGDAKPGSEIIAKGDITVWGVLGGIAHAGARGNDYARIRALKIHAIQLRISGFYARRPDSINIPFIQRTDTFTPEEARVNNEEIAIYKINEI